MSALLLDTSSSHGFVLLANQGTVLAIDTISDSRQLSKFLLPSIQSLWQGKPLDYIGTGIGPGSFTGTRIGANVAQTLAYALEIPLIGFSSTLVPDWEAIAQETYEKWTRKEIPPQIELVYFSPTA